VPDNISRFYVLVRTDIPIQQQVIQVGHACITAGSRFGCPDCHHLVLYGLPSRTELLNAAEALGGVGIRHASFYDPDDGLGWTALCTEPLRGVHRQIFRRYPLWSYTA
jgi:hypothetical protein